MTPFVRNRVGPGVVSALLIGLLQGCGVSDQPGPECGSDQHAENGACQPNLRACAIENGAGEQTWEGDAYSACTLASCNAGYEPRGGACARIQTFLSTIGNQIVDGDGNRIRISAVNWKGMESDDFAPIGLYAQPWRKLMDGIKANGFNAIRLPFSLEMLETTRAPNNIDFAKNPDLTGKTAMQIMDMVIDYARQLGLRVILDCHRRTADLGAQGTERDGRWYDATYTEAEWIAAWVTLARRYKNDPTVIGADLFNEPHSTATNTVTWGGGGANDWARAAEAAASAILTEHPQWLIFVEGISGHTGLTGVPESKTDWWGQNLRGVATRPIVPRVAGANVTNKVVYSAHVYPPAVLIGPAVLFDAPAFPANMPEAWNKAFGFIFTENRAPIWIGEFSSNLSGVASNSKCTLNDPREPLWINAFIRYLGGDFNLDGTDDVAADLQGMSWAYWGWMFDDCQRNLFLDVRFSGIDAAKISLLMPLQFRPF
jgi:endoglucanase